MMIGEDWRILVMLVDIDVISMVNPILVMMLMMVMMVIMVIMVMVVMVIMARKIFRGDKLRYIDKETRERLLVAFANEVSFSQLILQYHT